MPGPTPTNVLPFSPSGLPEVLTASVHSPGHRLDVSSNRVWLCPAYSGSRAVMLYVKPELTIRQLVAELVAAQIGALMRLPCPQPYIVNVQPHLVGGPRGPSIQAFGCEQVGPRSTAVPIRNLDIMLETLQKAKYAERAAVFDELIVNPVRSPGDVIFDLEGQVWLIDHEQALQPGIAPSAAVTNWLAGRLIEGATTAERVALLEKMRSSAASLHGKLIPRMPPELGRTIGAQIYQEMMRFVAERLGYLDMLISARVLPEQGHLEQPNTNTDSNDSSGTATL